MLGDVVLRLPADYAEPSITHNEIFPYNNIKNMILKNSIMVN